MRASLLTAVVALGALALVPASAGAEVVGKTIDISQEIYDDHGDPLLIGNASPVGGKALIWERCAPLAPTCEELPGRGSSLEPGETLPGTVFRVRRADVPDPEVVTSHPWGGRVTLTQPPFVTGEIKEMSRVVPHPGQWSGGWPGDTDAVTVFACKTRSSSLCNVVTGAWYSSGSDPVDRPIGSLYLGWKLFVVNYRNPQDALYPAVGLGVTRTNPLKSPDVTTAIVEFGRVADSPEYSVRLFSRTHRDRRDQLSIAKIKCPGACRVRINALITVKDGWSPYQATRTVHGSGTLRVPGTRFKNKKTSFWLTIKRTLVADGVVRISE